MDTTQNALNFVASRKYPFFKLYKGANRVAICDAEENPEKSPELANELFVKEISELTVGKYKVVVYRNSNGEKGGLSCEFDKSYSQPNSISSMNMDFSIMFEQAKREAERDVKLDRIEKKIDALAEAFALLNDKDSDNDGKAVDLLKTIFSLASKKPETAIKSIAPVAVGTNRGAFSDF